MYIVKNIDEKYDEYQIKETSTGTSFSILPEKGGLVTKFKVCDEDIFYLDEELLNQGGSVRAGGIPILFPICGAIKNGYAKLKNDNYEVPKHGFVRNLPWKVVETQEGQHGSITIEISDNEYTRSVFPFQFTVRYKYVLMPNEIQIIQNFVNKGNCDIPFYAGFHPFFNVGDKNKLKFKIDSEMFFDFTEGTEKKFDGVINFEKEIDYVFSLNKGSEYLYEMKDEDNNRIITISASQAYEYMVLWTVKNKPFVCVEPWMAKPDALNTGKGLKWLKPMEEKNEWTKILVSKSLTK